MKPVQMSDARLTHKVAFYADILYDSPLSPSFWVPPENLDVEAILLGGDINYSPDQLGKMLKRIRETQSNATCIVVVPGNGDYIDQELNESREQYRATVAEIPNAVFLDDEVTVLATGLRIIGSTLWSHVAEDEIDHYSKMLADHGLHGVDNIRLGTRYLTLRDTNELHVQARTFIEEQLRSLSRESRDMTIVCTHFWPTLRPWQGPDRPPAWEWLHMTGSDMDDLVANCGPKYWLCGHAHTTHDITIGNTLISSNPRAGDGPENVNPEFRESYILEL